MNNITKLWMCFKPIFDSKLNIKEVSLWLNEERFNESDVGFNGNHIDEFVDSKFDIITDHITELTDSVKAHKDIPADVKTEIVTELDKQMARIESLKNDTGHLDLYNEFFDDSSDSQKTLCRDAHKLLKKILGKYFHWPDDLYLTVKSDGKILLEIPSQDNEVVLDEGASI